METQKIDGIVLSVSKFKDHDVLATILTKNGTRKIKFTGVRKPKAKFAFAAQPFCHAEFLLSSSKDYAVVMGVEQKSDFFALTSDYDVFELGSQMLVVTKKIATENQDSTALFDLLLLGLSLLLAGAEPNLVECVFLSRVLFDMGVFAGQNVCVRCGSSLQTGALFDLQTGASYCKDCAPDFAVVCSKNVLQHITDCINLPLSNLLAKSVPAGVAKQAVEFLKKILHNQVG